MEEAEIEESGYNIRKIEKDQTGMKMVIRTISMEAGKSRYHHERRYSINDGP